MSRPTKVPTYRRHAKSGQAVVTVTGRGGRPRDVYLGLHGSPESPASHKTEHFGPGRTVALGPRAQGVPVKYMGRDPEQFCFCPAEAEAGRNAGRSDNRVIPLWDFRRKRNKTKRKDRRKRPPGSADTPASYARAISRACMKASERPQPVPSGKAGCGRACAGVGRLESPCVPPGSP